MDSLFLRLPQFLTIVLHPQWPPCYQAADISLFLMYSHILCAIVSKALFGPHRHLEYRPVERSWELHMQNCLCWSWKEQTHFKGAMERVRNWSDKKNDVRKGKRQWELWFACDTHKRINIHNYKQLATVPSQVGCIWPMLVEAPWSTGSSTNFQ